MHRIQKDLPAWVRTTGRQAEAMPLSKKLQALIDDRDFQGADKVADELLALMSSGR
jgi:hypothetical protein